MDPFLATLPFFFFLNTGSGLANTRILNKILWGQRMLYKSAGYCTQDYLSGLVKRGGTDSKHQTQAVIHTTAISSTTPFKHRRAERCV